jgi:hypothetical protein
LPSFLCLYFAPLQHHAKAQQKILIQLTKLV